MSKNIRILYVDDNPMDRSLVRDSLEIEHGGFILTEAKSKTEFEKIIDEKEFDVVLTDFNILGYEGLQVLDTVKIKQPGIPVIVVTGTGSEVVAVEAMKRGAADYVIKSAQHIKRLPQTILSALKIEEAITERELAEDKLLVNQYYLSKAQEMGKIGTWELDIQNDNLVWTDENYKIFGVPLGTKMNYSKFLKCVHPDDRDLINEKWTEALKTKEYDIEHRILTENKIKWVREKADFELDSEGNPIVAIGFAQDITERKEYEENIKESEERYRQLIDNSPEAIVIHQNGKVVFANNIAFKMIKDPNAEKLIGSDITNLLHPDELKTALERTAKLLMGESVPNPVEYRLKNFEGSYLDVEMSSASVKHKGKNAVQLIVRDITERKKAEKEKEENQKATLNLLEDLTFEIEERKKTEAQLKESEEKFRAIFENTLTPIVVADDNKNFTAVNKAAEKLFGYTKAELQQLDVEDIKTIFPLEDDERGKRFRKQGHERGEIEFVTKDGIERISHYQSVRIKDGFNLSMVSDITEQKRTLLALSESEDRFRNLVNTISSGVTIHEVLSEGNTGNDYILKEINNSALKMENIDKSKVVGKSLKEIRPEIEVHGLLPIFKKVWETGNPEYYPLHVDDDENNPKYFEFRVFKLHNGELVAVYDDVTEKTIALQNLKESEERFKSFMKYLPAGVFIKDAEGRYTYVNEFNEMHFGFNNWQGKTVYDFFDKETADRFRADEKKCLVEKYLKSENSAVNINGENLHIITHQFVISQNEKKLIGGISLDVTTAKMAELAIRESEEKFSKAFRSAPYAITITDPANSQLLEVNEGFARMSGYSIDEAIGKTSVELNLWVDDSDRVKVIEELKQGNSVVGYETRFRTKNGNIITGLYSAEPIEIKNKLRVLSSINDISERKRAEEELRKSEILLKNAEATAHLGYYELDLETGDAIWSDETFKIFGLDPAGDEPTVGTNNTLLHPEDAADLQRLLDECVKEKKTFDMTYRIIHSSNEIRYVHSIGNVVAGSAGQTDKMFGTLQDVTESKLAEEKLLESEEKYRSLFENQIESYAYHEIIRNKKGKPVDYKFIDVNEAFLEQTGLNSKEEIIGKTVLEIWPDTKKEWIEKYGNIALTGEPESFENYSIAQNKYYRVNAYSPRKGFFATSFLDITERKKYEEEILELNRTLTLSQKIAKLGYWSFNVKTQKPKWSEELFNMYGIPEEEGEPIYEEHKKYIHSEDWEYFDTSVKNLIENEVPYDIHIRLIQRDGNIVWVRTIGMSRKDETGKVVELYGTSLDITSIKKQEEEVRINLTKYKTLFANMPAGITITDNSGKIIESNVIAEKLLGLNEEEQKNRKIDGSEWSIIKLDGSKMPPEEFASVKALAENKTVANIEMGIDKGNNDVTWLSVTATPIPLENYGVLINYFDITERINANKLLKESEIQLRESQKVAHLGSYTWFISTGSWHSSDILDEIFGIDENYERSFEGWTNIIHPEWRDKMAEYVTKEVIGSKKRFDKQYKIIRQNDGAERWVHGMGEMEFDNKNQPVKLFGNISDITERKHALQALKESEERYKSVFENNYSVMLIINPDTAEIIDANPAACKFYGYDRDEFKNKKIFEINTLTEKEVFAEMVLAVKNKRNYFVFEHQLASGEIRNVEVYSGSVVMNNRKMLYSIIHDITEKIKFENALKESEEKFRSLAEGMEDYVMRYDKKHRHIYANPSALKVVRMTEDEFIGKTHREIGFDPNLCDLWDEKINNVFNTGQSDSAVFEWESAHGKVYLDWKVNPEFDENGQVVSALAVSRDITEMKKAEKELESINRDLLLAQKIAKVGYWEYDTVTHIPKWSDELFRMFGIPKANGAPIFEDQQKYIHQDDWELYYETVQDAVRTGDSYDIQIRVVQKNGNIVWIRSIGLPLDKANDGVSSLYGVAMDITDIKEAELAVKDSEEKLRAFFNSDMFGTIYGDIYGGIHRTNNKYLEIIGYSKDEVESGKIKWDKITPEEFRELEIEKINEAQKFGMCTPYEKQYIRKDGSRIWVIVGYVLVGEKKDQSLAFILDIQKIKEYQSELEKSNKFIQTVMDNLPIGVALNNISEGNAFYINKKFEQIYGWPANELNDVSNFFKKVYPDKEYRNKLTARVLEDIKSGDPSKMHWEDCIITHKDGSKHIVNAHNIPLYDQNTMVSTVVDITAEKLAEQKLKESEERYKTLVESAPDAIAIHQNNKLVFVNHASIKLLEAKSISDLIGRDYSKIVHPENLKEVKSRVKGILSGAERYYTIEERYITLKGNVVDVEVTAVPILFENKQALQVIVRDITERKRAEQQILKERNRAENYLEAAAVMMLALDKKGNVTMINKKGSEILGYSKNYIIGKNWIENFIPEDTRSKVKNIFGKAMKGEMEFADYAENKALCRYNKIKILGWHNTIIRDNSGKIIGTLSSAEDITERIRLKNELEKSNEELTRLSIHMRDIREKERLSLARELHDDLGQALTAIKMDLIFSRSTLREEDEILKKKINSAIDLATHSIKTTQQITSNLRPSMIDDLGLIPAVEWYTSQFTERSSMKINLDIKVEESDIKDDFKINIYRILQECLTNAARHSKATRVSIKFKKLNDNVILTINDNGIGLESNKLTDPNSFGLIGIKERTYSLNGEISFKGKKNKGTLVKVVFPLNK